VRPLRSRNAPRQSRYQRLQTWCGGPDAQITRLDMRQVRREQADRPRPAPAPGVRRHR
jgi:hypothetical protein